MKVFDSDNPLTKSVMGATLKRKRGRPKNSKVTTLYMMVLKNLLAIAYFLSRVPKSEGPVSIFSL